MHLSSYERRDARKELQLEIISISIIVTDLLQYIGIISIHFAIEYSGLTLSSHRNQWLNYL